MGEKMLLTFILGVSALVGFLHFELHSSGTTTANAKTSPEKAYPYWGSLEGLVGSSTVAAAVALPTGDFASTSVHSAQNAVSLAARESTLRAALGPTTFDEPILAFLVGFKRSLEGLAILPQYRRSLLGGGSDGTHPGSVDLRVYSWTLSLGLYHLSLSTLYFGKLHVITLLQAFSWLSFVLLAGTKVGTRRSTADGSGSDSASMLRSGGFGSGGLKKRHHNTTTTNLSNITEWPLEQGYGAENLGLMDEIHDVL